MALTHLSHNHAQIEHITLVDLLRHGEPKGGSRYRGSIDDQLSEKGWGQMWAAVSATKPWHRIVTSPMKRCAEFSEALSETTGLPLSQDSRLREVGFGIWEGKQAEELRRQDPDILKRFYRDPIGNQPPGSEPARTFVMRVASALEDLVDKHQGEHLLIVCHAGVIRAAIAHILDLPLRSLFQIKVENAHFTRLQFGGERPPTMLFHGRGTLDSRPNSFTI